MRAACQALLTELPEEKIKLLLVKRKPTAVFTLRDVMRKCGNTVGLQVLFKLLSFHPAITYNERV